MRKLLYTLIAIACVFLVFSVMYNINAGVEQGMPSSPQDFDDLTGKLVETPIGGFAWAADDSENVHQLIVYQAQLLYTSTLTSTVFQYSGVITSYTAYVDVELRNLDTSIVYTDTRKFTQAECEAYPNSNMCAIGIFTWMNIEPGQYQVWVRSRAEVVADSLYRIVDGEYVEEPLTDNVATVYGVSLDTMDTDGDGYYLVMEDVIVLNRIFLPLILKNVSN